jgi:uncharacterized DUF497 family protein
MKNGSLQFEWDSKKAGQNLRKHRVSFEEAATVFGDTYAVTYEDLDHSQQERRFMLIGASARRRLLIIAYEHRGATIRIINARRLTRGERKMYEEEDR